MLDLDRRASLVNQSDVLADGAGVPLPTQAECVIAVLAADARGNIAAVFGARTRTKPPSLLITDFAVEPIRQGLFAAIADRLDALAMSSHARMAFVYAPPGMRRHAVPAATGGFDVQEIPQELIDEEPLISAASLVANNQVKICVDVAEKSLTAPFLGSLNFRSSEKADDPLRRAAVLMIAMALDDEA